MVNKMNTIRKPKIITKHICPTCGSVESYARGYQHNKAERIKILSCANCGRRYLAHYKLRQSTIKGIYSKEHKHVN